MRKSMTGPFKTSAEWAKELADDVKILAPEGWQTGGVKKGYTWHIEMINREEFEERFAQSKVVIPRGIHFIWKDPSMNGRDL
jgi:hypothetical protein